MKKTNHINLPIIILLLLLLYSCINMDIEEISIKRTTTVGTDNKLDTSLE